METKEDVFKALHETRETFRHELDTQRDHLILLRRTSFADAKRLNNIQPDPVKLEAIVSDQVDEEIRLKKIVLELFMLPNETYENKTSIDLDEYEKEIGDKMITLTAEESDSDKVLLMNKAFKDMINKFKSNLHKILENNKQENHKIVFRDSTKRLQK